MIPHAIFSVGELLLKIPSASLRTMSKAPSIQVETAGEDPMFYKVARHTLAGNPAATGSGR